MKAVKKTISYKGINFELNVDINKLINDMRQKYRSAFSIVKNMVRSRERYIKKLHKSIRNRDNQMRVFTASANIYRKASKLYKLQSFDFDILAYMYDIRHTNLERINLYMKSIGGRKISGWTITRLTRDGYIINSEKERYYYISDKGKQVVDKVTSALTQDMTYYFRNKMIKTDWSNFVERQKVEGQSKYSDEERQERRRKYIEFMQPYWDFGKRKLPSNAFIRYSILRKWMEEKESAGEYVDPVYNKYLVNIQAKMAETK